MKYITAEKFLQADRKVIDSIIAWWVPSIGDLTESTVKGEVWCLADDIQVKRVLDMRKDHLIVPLLTVGQLIDFIESKTGYYLEIRYDENNDYGYIFNLGLRGMKHHSRYVDLLKALWELAEIICKQI